MYAPKALILASAHRHGISDDDMGHATRNVIDSFAQDDELTMLIGPSADGALLEIGIVDGQTGPVIVHAMKARTKYLR